VNQIAPLVCCGRAAGKTPEIVAAITSKQTTYESGLAEAGFNELKHFMFSLE